LFLGGCRIFFCLVCFPPSWVSVFCWGGSFGWFIIVFLVLFGFFCFCLIFGGCEFLGYCGFFLGVFFFFFFFFFFLFFFFSFLFFFFFFLFCFVCYPSSATSPCSSVLLEPFCPVGVTPSAFPLLVVVDPSLSAVSGPSSRYSLYHSFLL